jgi:coenzyme F420-0:L-glutamate ligase/coenzyme F420-1:gamma-L-glutamate ligase
MISADEMLAHLTSRRSVRTFADAPLERAVLERLLAAAVSAPSASNRQPWRFVVVTAPARRARIAAAARTAAGAIEAIVSRGPHAVEWGHYGDFFWQPLAAATAIIIPAVREHPDQIAGYLRSSGADPERFELPGAMHPERCAIGGAVMALLLQAHAERLGAAWMAGPMVARAAIEDACGIRSPWQMVGAIAVGHLTGPHPAPTPRKPIDDVVTWLDEDEEED